MDPNSPIRQNSSNEQPPEPDVWEPPFERWSRLADALLGNIPPAKDKVDSSEDFTLPIFRSHHKS